MTPAPPPVADAVPTPDLQTLFPLLSRLHQSTKSARGLHLKSATERQPMLPAHHRYSASAALHHRKSMMSLLVQNRIEKVNATTLLLFKSMINGQQVNGFWSTVHPLHFQARSATARHPMIDLLTDDISFMADIDEMLRLWF
ncbi:hypothetical protein LXL04_002636 [Taraxacum kok-saghyz]